MMHKLFLSLALSLLFFGCDNTAEPSVRTEFLLDTTCSIKVYEKISEKTFEQAFAAVSKVDQLMNVNDPGSEVYQINQNAGIKPVPVSSDTFFVIQKALEYSRISEGKFDITIGPLVQLWGINTDSEKVPSQSEINEIMPLVNYKNVILNEAERTVFLKFKEMQIDLGGIAKGYAADKAVNILRDKGIKYVLIDFGGNIYAMGSKPGGAAWNIAVQHPDASRNIYMGILPIENSAMVTSGIYERYFMEDGVRYHHILDPETGSPARNTLASVTIRGDTSLDADALSTAVFLMGLEEGFEFSQTHGDIDAIFITKKGSIFLTENIRDRFSLSDKSFTLRDTPEKQSGSSGKNISPESR